MLARKKLLEKYCDMVDYEIYKYNEFGIPFSLGLLKVDKNEIDLDKACEIIRSHLKRTDFIHRIEDSFFFLFRYKDQSKSLDKLNKILFYLSPYDTHYLRGSLVCIKRGYFAEDMLKCAYKGLQEAIYSNKNVIEVVETNHIEERIL
jgi:hypothetical protein